MDILGCVDIPTSVLLAALCLLLFYVYGKWRYRALKEIGMPGPEPMIFIGSTYEVMKIGFFDIHDTLGKRYGPVHGVYVGGLTLINVADLDVLKEVLVKDFSNFTDRQMLELVSYPTSTGLFFAKGVTWKRLRNILSPTFSGVKLRPMCDRINVCAKTLTKNFQKCAEKNEIVNVKDYFGAFTMDVIASTAFGIEVDSQNDIDNVFVTKAKSIFAGSFLDNFPVLFGMMFPSLCPLLRKIGVSLFPNDSVSFFEKTITEMIRERKQNPASGKSKQVDFLQLLINSEDEVEGDNSANSDDKDKDSTKLSKKMSTAEIMGQAFLFFVAGYETTGTSLHFTAHALATNPDKQEKLIEEIDSVLGDTDPNYDNIGDLKYLDNVITESLRLYPPVPIFTRQAARTVTIKGYTFPEGVGVQIPTVPIHRNPDNYPDPHKFKPERWDNKADMNPLAFLPFGYGPRLCIGMRLAQVEMKIALVTILKKMKFVRLEDTPDVLEFGNTNTLTPTQPIMLRVELR